MDVYITVKKILLDKNMKLRELAEKITTRKGETFPPTSLATKLKREHVSFGFVESVFNALGFDIVLKERDVIQKD